MVFTAYESTYGAWIHSSGYFIEDDGIAAKINAIS